MEYVFFCDHCGTTLAGNEKKLTLACENCGRHVSENEFYRQLDKLRDQDFCEQFISKSRQERREYGRGVRAEEAAAPAVPPAPFDAGQVPGWAAQMTEFLSSFQGTSDDVYFTRLGIDIYQNDCGKRLYDLFFGRESDQGNVLLFVTTILDTFDYWERITYCDITRDVSRMYGAESGEYANGMINMGERTVLGGMEAKPPPDLFLESFRFYESGPWHLDHYERVYATSFPQPTTRHVNVELGICNSVYRRQDKVYQVIYQWLRPDGGLLAEQEGEWVIISEYPDFGVSRRYGFDQPGQWTPGTYRLAILVDGVLFARRPFTIAAGGQDE